MATETAAPANPAQAIATVPKVPPAPRKSLAEEFPWLPLTISVEVPVPGFTVQDLIGLQPGSVVKTLYQSTADVPLKVNGKLVAWSKFEVAGDRLASRITELA